MTSGSGRIRPLQGWSDPPDTIRHWHLDPEAAQGVGMWFGGWVPQGARLDGNRSVLLALPDTARWIKIKGAGLDGNPVTFGSFRARGPKALWFDFEGRVAEDVASGHDAAQVGGASFQQAVVEWQVTAALQAAGIPALPCLGYGRISRGAYVSWFSVFDWNPADPGDLAWPKLDAETFLGHGAEAGKLVLRLACDFGLIGFPWFLIDHSGRRTVKDLHPFRLASPVNMSQLTFVMHVFHALHIIASDIRLRSGMGPPGVLPPDVQTLPFRAALPDVTLADHLDAIDRVLLPYMLQPAPGFRPEALALTLRSNRITAALMDHCPPAYARFD